MTRLIIAVTALVAASFVAQPADAAKRKKARVAPQAQVYSQGPARMIEVRPGLWVSSYGCIQDEGYGRTSPCENADGVR